MNFEVLLTVTSSSSPMTRVRLSPNSSERMKSSPIGTPWSIARCFIWRPVILGPSTTTGLPFTLIVISWFCSVMAYAYLPFRAVGRRINLPSIALANIAYTPGPVKGSVSRPDQRHGADLRQGETPGMWKGLLPSAQK